MGKTIKYYIVAADALPEIFVKVAEAKRMMQAGEADTVGEATRLAGISRSAFYKYKDSVRPFNDMKSEHIITFQAMLKDSAGVLSRVLAVFAASGANILTINQSIPTNGCAAVTISAETSEMAESLEQLVADAGNVDGVVKFEILAG
ncbi:ACT domain-containing protein [uncultured Oscillibacter sp.]|uniref:ACT domain-containing protein n=1 Tax=uncultured Oscillibacter sp. TaxID=876091 RepID=UPI0025FCAEDA|nr:ACT domain-containing protein [uncultured Oscillibacter sp.]